MTDLEFTQVESMKNELLNGSNFKLNYYLKRMNPEQKRIFKLKEKHSFKATFAPRGMWIGRNGVTKETRYYETYITANLRSALNHFYKHSGLLLEIRDENNQVVYQN